MSVEQVRSAPSIEVDGTSHGASLEGEVLLVGSDPSLASDLVEQLHADRFQAVLARGTEHARTLARMRTVRAIILGELEAPRGTLDLLEEIRGAAAVDAAQPLWNACLPTIVIGSGAGQLEMLRAFDAGADDFIAGPVSYLELRARLRALLRRAEGFADTRVVSVGSLAIDTAGHAVNFAGVQVELCRLEYELLLHLARRPTTVFPKRELLRAIWNRRTDQGARTLDSHASRLRRKLDAVGANGLVVNVRGVGYRLV